MLDLAWMRDNPAALDAALEARGGSRRSGEVLALDGRRRALVTARETRTARINAVSRSIGEAARSGDADRVAGLKAEAGALKEAAAVDDGLAGAEEELERALLLLPNVPAPDVPPGTDEAGNVEVRRVGTPPAFTSEARDHVALGEGLGLDVAAATRMSGARFSMLRGQLARLERALGQFMLDMHVGEHGYEEVSPPLLVDEHAMRGTGQLPKFADDLFRTTDGRWLIPTAEVSLTNVASGQVLPPDRLPMRLTALTPCFRGEAGSAGRDVRGLIRQHQFHKVELVSLVAPEDAEAEHLRMLGCAEAVLRGLELPYRVMLLCAGDMGFSARRTYDLEVWLPGQGAYREISSVSDCGDFQARRMGARMQVPGGKPRFLHTLNGSGVAVGRALVAVLENHQRGGGEVVVPAALRPYMGGVDLLVPA